MSGQIAINSQGGIGGPGGWGGGNGGSIASPGQGPGGGLQAYGNALYGGNASFGSAGNQNINPNWYPVASSGSVYGNSFLLPLIGGSGGGGAQINSGRGGGGGGGAILVAAAIIQLNGLIKSEGGTWGNGGGGQGSGAQSAYVRQKLLDQETLMPAEALVVLTLDMSGALAGFVWILMTMNLAEAFLAFSLPVRNSSLFSQAASCHN